LWFIFFQLNGVDAGMFQLVVEIGSERSFESISQECGFLKLLQEHVIEDGTCGRLLVGKWLDHICLESILNAVLDCISSHFG